MGQSNPPEGTSCSGSWALSAWIGLPLPDTWSTVHASPGKLGFPGLARAGQAPGRSRACPLAPDLYP